MLLRDGFEIKTNMAQDLQTGQLGPQFYRQLGQTDIKVSLLSFGGAHLQLDDPESKRTVHEAIKAGINFIDTSPYYRMGEAQRALGQVSIFTSVHH